MIDERQPDHASRREPCASTLLTSDCEIPNCLAIVDGLTPRPQYNLAGAFLNGGWQRIVFALFAIGHNLCRILFQAVVVQNIVLCGCVVVAAHEIPYEIPVRTRVS